MAWADDLLKNLSPEQKRAVADGLAKIGTFALQLATQIASRSVAPPEAAPEKAPAELPSTESPSQRAMQADLRAVRASGIGPQGVQRIEEMVKTAYMDDSDQLSDSDMADMAYAIKRGNANISASVDTITHIDAPSINGTQEDVPHEVADDDMRLVRMAMDKQEYERIQRTGLHPGLRARWMAENLGLQSDTQAIEYHSFIGQAVLMHSSFHVCDGIYIPVRERPAAHEHAPA
jgi:hypothetical protein